MPHKKVEEKQNLLHIMDNAIRNLNDRKNRLRAKLNRMKTQSENDEEEVLSEEEIASMQKELKSLDVQLDFYGATRDKFATQLKQAESEKKKEELENIVKGSILIGAMNESIRKQKEEVMTKLKEEADLQAMTEEAADELFSSQKFVHVKRNQVEEILNDIELQIMAKSDPTKLERDEQDMRFEYEEAMHRALRFANMPIDPDFDVNQKRFKEFQEAHNGYESNVKTYLDSGEIEDDIKQLSTQESVREVEYLTQELRALAKLTREAQNEFVRGWDYEKGSPYTKELIEREKQYVARLRNHICVFETRQNEMGNETDLDKIYLYKIALRLFYTCDMQKERDELLYRNNLLREKMEKWIVFQSMPKETRGEIRKAKRDTENFSKAMGKINRLMKYGKIHGGILETTADVAAVATQEMLLRMQNPEPLKEADKQYMIERFALITLHQLVVNDRNCNKEGYYYQSVLKQMRGNVEYLSKDKGNTQIQGLAKEIAQKPEFKNQVLPLLDGRKMRSNLLKLLANDGEKSIAVAIENARKAGLQNTPEAAPARQTQQAAPSRKN